MAVKSQTKERARQQRAGIAISTILGDRLNVEWFDCDQYQCI
jgi:hypothetical protein